jgi:hypothetical protein
VLLRQVMWSGNSVDPLPKVSPSRTWNGAKHLKTKWRKRVRVERTDDIVDAIYRF